jgi:hypothetical protein
VHHIACTLEKGQIWVALPKKIGDQVIYPNELSGWRTDTFVYKDIPTITGYVEYIESTHDKTWSQIKEWLFKFIELAANRGNKLYARSEKTHSPGVLKYLDISDRNVEGSAGVVIEEQPEVETATIKENPFESLIAKIEILRKDLAHTERAHESLVESFYAIIGYKTTSEIKYQIGRIDVSISVDEKILIVNEVKKDWDLSWKDEKARRQGYNYAHETGAQYVVLTNGDYYAIFDLNKGISYRDNFIGDFNLSRLTEEKLKLINVLEKQSFK